MGSTPTSLNFMRIIWKLDLLKREIQSFIEIVVLEALLVQLLMRV